MAPHPAVDAWWVWLGHLKGKKGQSALARSLFGQWGHLSEETAFGLSNMALGFSPSLSGSLSNPLSNGSSAFMRALFWGLAFHGRPDEAASWAAMDASLDHSGDGVWLPSLAAWIVASARPGIEARHLVSEAVKALPIQSKFHLALPLILEKAGDGEMPRELRLSLADRLGIPDEHDAVLTFAWAVAGLVAHPASFGSPVLAAAGCGGSADQSCAFAACVSSLIHDALPKEWLAPLGEEYVGSHALKGIQTEGSLKEFADLVVDTYKKRGRRWEKEAPPLPAIEAESGLDSEEPKAEAKEPALQMVPDLDLAPPSQNLTQLLAKKEGFTSSEANSIEVKWTHLDEPILGPGQSLRLVLSFTNQGEDEAQLHPELILPEGWKFATRMSPFRLPGGASQEFALVVVAPEAGFHERHYVRLKLGTAEHRTPILPTFEWMSIGPFVNHEGSAFLTTISAENTLEIGRPYVGRSEMMVNWEPLHQKSVWLDVEPAFKSGPGAILMAAQLRFPSAGSYKMTIVGSPGVIASVDGIKVISYHDDHTPVPRRKDRYSANFATTGESMIRLKLLRGKSPCAPLIIWFSTPEGQIVQPISLPLKGS